MITSVGSSAGRPVPGLTGMASIGVAERRDTRVLLVNPLLRDLLQSYRYLLGQNQAEYTTDVLIKNRPVLRDLYSPTPSPGHAGVGDYPRG